MDSEHILPDEAQEAPAAPGFAAMSFTYAAPPPEPERPTGTMLASIVPVRAYDGETEEQALARSGLDATQPGCNIVFVHID